VRLATGALPGGPHSLPEAAESVSGAVMDAEGLFSTGPANGKGSAGQSSPCGSAEAETRPGWHGHNTLRSFPFELSLER